MKRFFLRVWRIILDGVFPAFCIGCKVEGVFLCEECLKMVPRLRGQVCPWCYRKSEFGAVCENCVVGGGGVRGDDSARVAAGGRFLDGVLVGSAFEEHSLLQKAIHQLKYEFVKDLAEPLGQFLTETFLAMVEKNPQQKFILCPLPLHHKRLRWRGFNQAELLCAVAVKWLHQAGYLNVEVQQLLTRVHFSRPQMELTREERTLNMKEAFVGLVELVGLHSTASTNTTVVLVDDIATTLSTLENAASALKLAGVREVYSLVLARVF